MIENIKNVLISEQLFLLIVLISIIIDFVTGITKAIYNKNIQSEKLRKTIPKIIGYASIILIAICIQLIWNLNYITEIIISFIIVIEFLSTLENVSNYVAIPKFLLKFLEEKRDELDNNKTPYYIPDIEDAENEESEDEINA